MIPLIAILPILAAAEPAGSAKQGSELASFALVLMTGLVGGWLTEFVRSGRATRASIEKMAEEAIGNKMGEFERRVGEIEGDTKALGERVHQHEMGSRERLAALQVSIERNCVSKADLADFRKESKEDHERVRKSIHDIRNALQQIANKGGR